MGNDYLYDIFISYAKEDESFARRLSYDFTRHHLRVWDFRSNSQFGVNFINEFLTQLNSSNYYCLIDTNAARKAPYVKIEAEHAFQKQKKLLFCRFGPIINETSFCEEHDCITYFNLHDDYDIGFRKICQHLCIQYVPNFTLPRDKDFLYELTHIRMHEKKIETQVWEKLLKEYESFRSHFAINKTYAKAKLVSIIADCELLGLKLFSPYLALGNLYAVIEQHESALKIYMKADSLFQSDPRILAGLGGAHYHLKNYYKAVEFYSRCLTLIYSRSEESHKDHIIEIAHNLYQALIETEGNCISNISLNVLLNDESRLEITALKGKDFLLRGMYFEAATYLENAYTAFKSHHLSPHHLNAQTYFLNVAFDLMQAYEHLSNALIEKKALSNVQIYYQKQMSLLHSIISELNIELSERKTFALSKYLAEAYRDVGKCLLNTGSHVNEAINYYLQAIQIVPSIKYLSEIAMIYYRFNNSSEGYENLRKYLDKCFTMEKENRISSSEDVYYLGLCYFLNGKGEVARYMYEKSNQNKWPFYKQLLE